MFSYNYKLVTSENTILKGSIKSPLKVLAVKSLQKDASTVLFIQKNESDFFKFEISFLTKKKNQLIKKYARNWFVGIKNQLIIKINSIFQQNTCAEILN